MIFQHFPYTEVWGRRFDLTVKKFKGQPTTIIWTKFVDLKSAMLYTSSQPQSFFGSGEEEF